MENLGKGNELGKREQKNEVPGHFSLYASLSKKPLVNGEIHILTSLLEDNRRFVSCA